MTGLTAVAGPRRVKVSRGTGVRAAGKALSQRAVDKVSEQGGAGEVGARGRGRVDRLEAAAAGRGRAPEVRACAVVSGAGLRARGARAARAESDVRPAGAVLWSRALPQAARMLAAAAAARAAGPAGM